jgi:hypothetical protein
MAEEADLQQFLDLSAHLSGYDRFRLQGTGQVERYLSTVIDVVGETTVSELLQTYDRIRKESGDDPAAPDNLLRAEILSDDKLGPLARNIVKLWFVGTWYQLPSAWRAAFGALEKDTTFVVSPDSYTEGLLWPTVGANPPGAKGSGYASWTGPPRIDIPD